MLRRKAPITPKSRRSRIASFPAFLRVLRAFAVHSLFWLELQMNREGAKDAKEYKDDAAFP